MQCAETSIRLGGKRRQSKTPVVHHHDTLEQDMQPEMTALHEAGGYTPRKFALKSTNSWHNSTCSATACRAQMLTHSVNGSSTTSLKTSNHHKAMCQLWHGLIETLTCFNRYGACCLFVNYQPGETSEGGQHHKCDIIQPGTAHH